jgi:thiol-disulfide isomerase/thioredoxin
MTTRNRAETKRRRPGGPPFRDQADPKKARRAEARAARQRELRSRAGLARVRRAGILVATILVVAGLGFAIVRGGSGGVAFAGDLRAGGTLDSLKLPTLVGKGQLDYEGMRDRPVVLNFFASWCPFCVGEMPAFEQVHRDLGPKVVFLGVSQSDSRSASIDLVKEAGVTYATGIDAQGSFFNAIGTASMPTTLFVRPGGTIAYVQAGPLDEKTLTDYIGRYLGVQT